MRVVRSPWRLGFGLGAVAVALGGCGEERILESESELVDDLVVTFYLQPDTARAGEPVRARLGISNPGSRSVSLTLVEGCAGELSILDPDGSAVTFSGADTCRVWDDARGWAVPADTSAAVELVPGDAPFWTQWDLTAAVEDPSHPGSTHPPVPGSYAVRLVTPSPFPTLETELSVLAARTPDPASPTTNRR